MLRILELAHRVELVAGRDWGNGVRLLLGVESHKILIIRILERRVLHIVTVETVKPISGRIHREVVHFCVHVVLLQPLRLRLLLLQLSRLHHAL